MVQKDLVAFRSSTCEISGVGDAAILVLTSDGQLSCGMYGKQVSETVSTAKYRSSMRRIILTCRLENMGKVWPNSSYSVPIGQTVS